MIKLKHQNSRPQASHLFSLEPQFPHLSSKTVIMMLHKRSIWKCFKIEKCDSNLTFGSVNIFIPRTSIYISLP